MSRSRSIALAFALMALALLATPFVFRSSLAISVLSQIGCTIIICLSCNLLLGQGGMLSFGHAVYTGAGAFITVHAVQSASTGTLPVPLICMPLVGGLGAMLVAGVIGLINTRRSGTTFAMITLGMGELVAAVGLMFPQLFGGEGGISIDRVYGQPLWGLTFGPARQLYWLIAVYCLLCTLAMYGFTQTPLGRMLNAVRDNPQRVEFIGYNPQRVRYLAFVVAGFFAGVGGALLALQLEIVTAADSLGTARSGMYLLFTFLGGSAFFFGPVMGAVMLVCATVLLSGITKAWLLYLGLLFVLVVMYAPGGMAGIVLANARLFQRGQWKRLIGPYLLALIAALMGLAGAAALIEMVYHLPLDAVLGTDFELLGLPLDAGNTRDWLVAGLLALAGWATFAWARRRLLNALEMH